MTREEARDILKKWYKLGNKGLTDEGLGYIESWFSKEDKEAFILAINVLCCFDQISWERDMAISQLEELGYSLGEKQEPCVTMRDLSEEELKHFAEEMKKVRVQVVEQEPILDKVRAEIEHVIDYTYDSTDYDKALYNRAYKDGLYEALDIIDKYNAESEEV